MHTTPDRIPQNPPKQTRYNTTLEIFEDKEAHGAWNWVLEMYGYSLATYRAGQHANMKVRVIVLP